MDKKELEKNIGKLLTRGKSIMLAYDHGLEHGPGDFSDENEHPEYILKIARKIKPNALILQKGIAERYYTKKLGIPLVIKLNGKTSLFKGEPVSRQICSVEEAIDIGATAVGYTIYIGSRYESEMMREFGKIEEEAHKHSIPIITWLYPRGKSVKQVTNELVEYAARVGLEIGADFAKVKYTGDAKSYKKVVDIAGKCRVLAVGGEKTSDLDILKEAQGVRDSGACGLAIGRNVWQNENPEKISRAVKEIIFENKNAEQALKLIEK
jgi:fructose-bisphosphate aldolase, class I